MSWKIFPFRYVAICCTYPSVSLPPRLYTFPSINTSIYCLPSHSLLSIYINMVRRCHVTHTEIPPSNQSNIKSQKYRFLLDSSIPEMPIRCFGRHPPTRSPVEQTVHQKIRFIHIFQCPSILAQRCRQRLQSDRTAGKTCR